VTTATRALARAVTEKELLLLRRYWLNTVGGLGANYIMFAVVFFGGQSAAPGALTDTLPGIIVGFFVWSMSWSAFQTPSQGLMREARWGTLEQLYASTHGLGRVLAVRIVVTLAVSLVTGSLVLVAMMATTNQWLAVDLLAVVPLSVVTLLPAVGLGFAFGGIALLHKRVENVFLVVQFLFLAGLGAPETAVTDLLPLSLGADLLTTAMRDGVSLWALPHDDLVLAVTLAIAYLGLGAVAFRFALVRARREGVMGHY
jgi:ABC-2 type transport system permease protein